MVEIPEALIGTGLLGTVAGYLLREGAHRKEHERLIEQLTIIREEMKDRDDKITGLEERVHEQEVVQATILVNLDYIKEGIDELRSSKKGV